MNGLHRRTLLLAAAWAPIIGVAHAQSAPADAKLYIIWPHDGDRVKSPFWCRFGLRNMGIAPAGVHAPNTGHHHLFLDVDEPLTAGEVIPSDKSHLHFGAGQTEAYLDLPAGRHSLQLVMGDADHKIFDPPLASKKIHITVD
jgi:Domain of unknown function (DUF4399)